MERYAVINRSLCIFLRCIYCFCMIVRLCKLMSICVYNFMCLCMGTGCEGASSPFKTQLGILPNTWLIIYMSARV